MSPAVAEAPPVTGTFVHMAIAAIAESTTNPRKRFGDLEDLAASIKTHGVIEPVILRVRGAGYELVAGARRFRAAKLAGLTEIPAVIHDYSDHQALEVQVIENLQRKDVHPLEEADGYAALLAADKAYTVDAIAARVSRSPDYVYKRLRLRNLIDDARDAFEKDEITPAHAVRLARLTPEQQKRAFPECFFSLFGRGSREVQPVSHLDAWIADHTKVDVADRDAVKHYLPELHEQLESQPDPAASLVALSDSMVPGHYLDKKHGLIPRSSWKEVKSEKACPHTKRGVIVHGGKHRLLWICAKKGCSKHWPAPKKAATPKATAKSKPVDDWKVRQERERQERALWDKVESRAYAAIAKAVAGTKLTDAIWQRALESLLGYDLSRKDGQAAFRAAGIDLTVEHLAAIVRFVDIVDDCYGIERFRAVVKREKLAIDVDAIVADVAPAASKAPAPAKAKKGGRK